MSTPYTRLVSDLLFPCHEWLKGHDTVRVRREMERSQWWGGERLRALQLERLRRLVTLVGEHVPYYRDLFRALGVRAGDVPDMTFLHRLPLLSKTIVREQGECMKSVRAGRLMRYNTGGSSGEPLVFYIGKERVTHDVAAKWRATRWWDVDIGDPEIVLWGSPIELTSQDRIRQARDALLRTELLPAFEMSEARVEHFVARIRRRRPSMLFGYPSALAHIAAHAQQRGQIMSDLGIKVAFVTSERLYDHQREQIERVFGCRVANGYGGRDAGFIAHECPAGGMHITTEDMIVEIVDAAGNPLPQDTSGEIVVTHLATPDFPFIRYRTGDIGMLGKNLCACGRGLPLLKSIEGRTTDFIVAADGTVMHGLALIYVLRDLPAVKAFKIIQESLELTRVQLVAGEGYTQTTEATICEGLRKRLGRAVEVRVERLDAIPPERSGKHRYVVSKVAAGQAQHSSTANALG